MQPKLSLPAPARAPLLALLMVAALAGSAPAQCILANPSFEVAGSGGVVFGGWNQFGSVGLSTIASHGHKAARVRGPNAGGWDMSGFWQAHTCAAGESFEVTGNVLVPSSRPLAGACLALVNVEWRDGAGNLIDYDANTVAAAGGATDAYLPFSLTAGPAPAGSATARLLLGVLQSPSDPSPDVYYDQVTLYSTAAPTIDDVQWNDFPGGRTLDFAGRLWRVKGPGYYSPGGNLFSDSQASVWVDAAGALHLTAQRVGSNWYCTEVAAEAALGYGDYVVTTVGRLDLLDPQVVLGLFLWEYGPCWDEGYLWWNAFNEIDIEYSRWGVPSQGIGQFVAQPWDWSGNLDRFDATFSVGEVTSHAMRWLPDRVEFRVWRGGPQDESAGNLIHAWTYTGPHIPRPEQPRTHLNLWKLSGTPATNQEVVISDFRFVPEGATAVPDDRRPGPPMTAAGCLRPSAPNPFNPSTTLRFELDRAGRVELEIFDLAGRRVRTLVRRGFPAGTHAVEWDGCDGGGSALPSGVYLVRLRGDDFIETGRLSLVR
ncbi:MAG: FlgD immunoglobulin-like domain containing protein [bacterium]|nr:FlgD immunoglobulin-like domain containing protein [bacterium]